MADHTIQKFASGTHNLLNNEVIPPDSASESLNWTTKDGVIYLTYGRLIVGDLGLAGQVQNQGLGYKTNGQKVIYRKKGTVIQYLNVTTWVNVVTGLNASHDYIFANYTSLAGSFTFALGRGGIFKFHNANPGSYIDMYDATKNFKAKGIVDKARMIIFDIENDPTGLRGSYIDTQTSAVYTSIANEVVGTGNGSQTTFTGTLAFKGSNPKANAFGLLLNLNPSGITALDDFNGIITGTIKATNTFTLTSQPLDNETITIGGQVYRFKNTIAQLNDIKIGASLAVTQTNIVGAINGNQSLSGTGYFAGTITNAFVTMSAFSANVSTLTAITGGIVGNLIATTETIVTGGAFSSATLLGGSEVNGTINYITGAYSLTFSTAPAGAQQIRISYQWENSNNKGVTDFTYSPSRLAGEGFVLRQDEGGDAIQNVILGLDGSYYSIKKYSIYRLTLDSTDTKPYNEVYRKDLGIPYWQAATATGRGIIFMNTANPKKPELTVLEKNPLGDNIIPTVLVPHFKFENFSYDQAVFETWQEYIVISCRTTSALTNDRILLINITDNSVDTYGYRAKCLKKDAGDLYAGDTITDNTYKLFDGFDDDGSVITNFWKSRGEKYGVERLKKYRRQKIKGRIQSGQVVGVYVETDDGDFKKVGTIRGDAETIDNLSDGTVGSSMVGENMVGGLAFDPQESITVYDFFFELKIRTGKFRKRRIQFIAEKFGYVEISFLSDWDIMLFDDRIPKRFRRKQNVSLDGTLTDQSA